MEGTLGRPTAATGERRENRRDAFERILRFLRTHVPPVKD